MKMMMVKKKKIQIDRLSDLPDSVLFHIMSFMDAKHVVQTCVLSKRWKDLWKDLINLTFDDSKYSFWSVTNFSRFVFWVLSSRNNSMPLLNLDIKSNHFIKTKLLKKIMEYLVMHNVKELRIRTLLCSRRNSKLDSCIFSCQSLTSLKLCVAAGPSQNKLPKSLQLRALKRLHLEYFTFTASDDDCAEPFSNCNKLDSLVIGQYSFSNDAKVLCISNSNLSSLTILRSRYGVPCKIVLSTPNLTSLTIWGCSNFQLSSTCSLPFLEEVYTTPSYGTSPVIIISWLRVLANVKVMTFCSSDLKGLLKDISNPGSVAIQPPCFVRLELLRVKMHLHSSISDEELKRIVGYLLQNSPQAGVDIIKCAESNIYGYEYLFR